MKITLDHNCLVHLEQKTPEAQLIDSIIANPSHECFVVNIGASEQLKGGGLSNDYNLFESQLAAIGLARLPRLEPMLVWDVTFSDRCVWGDDVGVQLTNNIEAILFPQLGDVELESERKKRNRLCDIHSLWCHIRNGNDVFLTTDKNFTKASKLPRLIALGAKRICCPEDL